MQKTLRAFIAVPIPDAVVAFLRKVQEQLQSSGLNLRWVVTDNIHLTLKFLGDIDRNLVSDVADRMDAAARTIPPFLLKASGVGVFPNRRQARVLWVGMGGDLECLKAIQTTLEAGLESVGFSTEARRFQPHLTIGRSRRRLDAQTLDASLEPLKAVCSDSFRVDRLQLLRSKLTPAGAIYSRLHTSHLAT
jgi:2'-5' RNA ligase